ncbi:MAG: hypothetical protein IKN38_07065 [Clostridia bacterium]|nr:hypothetical protein [Clostridia bacterium]
MNINIGNIPDARRVTRCEDGKYRWVYEVSLFKNPTVFVLIWKIFFFIFLGIFAFVMIMEAVNGTSVFLPERLLSNLKIFGYILIGMTAVVGISYLIYAAIMGGKYIVEFEMDDNGIYHRQIEQQARKARKIGQTTMILGAASGNFGMMGAGIGATRTEMYSDFTKVRKVKPYPRRDLIKVNNALNHNQIYAKSEDFEFVKEFILSHCINLK